ncbi:MAG TPA: hypothetical protein VGV69_07265 [Solirubrobacterales bacterium]|nr:hypothetical protein [Solirubrobacterales bacterium]
MSAPRKIGLFVAGLLVILGAGVALGSMFESADTEGDGQHGGGHAAVETSEGAEEQMGAHTGHAERRTEDGAEHGGHDSKHEPAGLAVSAGGYTLRMSPTQVARGEDFELRFAIEDAAGEPVTEFDELHERRMHLIVVRRDGAEFRHLHPEMDEAGTWTEAIGFAEPGVYRAFADFSVGGEQHTLASDVFVSGGDFEARPFPAATPVDSTAGYEVRLRAGKPVAGEPSTLTFAVDQGGHGVHDLAPYLGAKGHLVALREGDLAFLHVHPEEAGGEHRHGGAEGDGHEGSANEIAFAATFPTAGRYRLYLQFKHDDAVRTVEYTVEVSR